MFAKYHTKEQCPRVLHLQFSLGLFLLHNPVLKFIVKGIVIWYRKGRDRDNIFQECERWASPLLWLLPDLISMVKIAQFPNRNISNIYRKGSCTWFNLARHQFISWFRLSNFSTLNMFSMSASSWETLNWCFSLSCCTSSIITKSSLQVLKFSHSTKNSPKTLSSLVGMSFEFQEITGRNLTNYFSIA